VTVITIMAKSREKARVGSPFRDFAIYSMGAGSLMVAVRLAQFSAK
jgi:hypothetical protein